jgi:hypothetical protein
MKSALLHKFESGEIEVSTFGHREHLQTAWEMLRTYPFIEAVARFARQLQGLATAAGAPEKFNLTVTVAFMSLIAEAMEATPDLDFDRFCEAHPDLRQNPLKHWYSDQRLGNDLARRIFLMPDAQAFMDGGKL